MQLFSYQNGRGASTDNLEEINGGDEGDVIILGCGSGTEDVIFIDATSGGTGMRLAGDFTADHPNDTLMLVKNGTTWYEVSRSNNK